MGYKKIEDNRLLVSGDIVVVNLFGFFSYLSYLTHQISTKAMVFDG